MANDPAFRIYTRTGDAGDTGLFDGTRVSKSDPRVEAYGDVDELASWLGLVRARLGTSARADWLHQIQRDLFAMGAHLADPRRRIAARVEKAALTPDDVVRLERWIDETDESLPPLRRFILAGGSETAATLHLSRAVCRRAERRVVGLGDPTVDATVIVYLNRLSDLLFVLARAINADEGVSEIEW